MTDDNQTYEAVRSSLASRADGLTHIAESIFDFAETKFTEYQSAELLASTLEKEGFTVERGIAGIETAFMASFGEGGPCVAVLGEYDALFGLSQKPDTAHREALVEHGNGHACGHNLLGTASLAAALAAKEALVARGLKGSVRYYGCPGEEGGSGKTFMAREGVFDDIDVAICWHPAPDNIIWSASTLANIQVEYRFKGTSAHAAASPELGRSALDAVELMNVGANYLREHVIQEARFHYAMTNGGGLSPNVVQPEASVLYLIRAPQIYEVQEIYERINKIAQGAALMTETEVSIHFEKACSNYIPNVVLAKLMQEVFEDVGVPVFTDEERAFAHEVRQTLSESERAVEFASPLLNEEGKRIEALSKDKDLSDFLYPYSLGSERLLSGSTDVGDVSWVAPTVQCLTACFPRQTSAHSWQWTTTGRGSIGMKGMLHAGLVMGATAIRLFESPELVEDAKRELGEKTERTPYNNPIPANVQPKV
jgi:aminobenzoyl-glutamate utilization protein B